jgi:hypothetical protein
MGFFHAMCVSAGSMVYGGGGSGEPTTREAVHGGRGVINGCSFSPGSELADAKMASRTMRNLCRTERT